MSEHTRERQVRERPVRVREEKDDGRIRLPTFIIHPEDIPQEDSYLVLVGPKRLCSSFINGGDPVVRGQVIFVSSGMLQVLLRRTWVNPRTNDDMPIWMLATEKQITTHTEGGDVADPESQAAKELARNAREESISSGHASFETEKEAAEHKAVQATRTPRQRRRRNSSEENSEES